MPVCYGGGIHKISHAEQILSSGIEKICTSSAAIKNMEFLHLLSKTFGKQSISVVVDIRKINGEYSIFTHNGKINTHTKIIDYLLKLNEIVGEIVINNIDRDGRMGGADKELIKKIYSKVNVPLVVLGGFGTIDQVKDFFHSFEIIGVACASMFLYKGKNNAVLINYPIDQIKKY